MVIDFETRSTVKFYQRHLIDVTLNQPLVLHTFSRICVPKMGDSLRMLYPTWFDCKSAHGLCCMMSLERASVEGSWQNWR